MERIKLNIQKFAENEIEVQLVAAIEEFQKSVNSAQSSLNGLKKNIKQTSDETDRFKAVAKELKSAFSSINLSGIFNSIKRLGKSLYSNFLTKAVDTSEELNLFNVVFDNIQKNGETTFSELGDHATKFQKKLNEAFGTNMKETMRYQGLFQSMGESAGLSEDVANLMSENMTKLSYDLASLYNTTETKAAESLRAGVYAGQTKPLRNYGIDVTQTSFKPIMEDLGIEKSVNELSQGEKEILRYIATLNQAGNAMGDFANTIESPANQLKVLKQQFYEMQAAIGNLFVGAFARILPYVNAIIMVIKELAKAIASFFGIEMQDYNTGIASYTEDLDDYSAGLGGVADGADKAGGAIKALKRQTLGFDQINNLTSPTPSSGGSGGGGGAGGGVAGGIDKKLLDALKGYENGMEAVRMKASQIRDAIMKWLGFIYDSEKGVWRLKDGWSNIKTIIAALGTLGLIVAVKKVIDKIIALHDWVAKIKTLFGGAKTAVEGTATAGKGLADSFTIAGSSALGWTGIVASAVIQTTNLVGQTKKMADKWLETKSIWESIKPTSFGDLLSKLLAGGTLATTPLGTLGIAFTELGAGVEKFGELFGKTSSETKKEVADIKKKLDPVKEDLYKFTSDFAQIQVGVTLDENSGETIMGHLDKLINDINTRLNDNKQQMIDQLNDLLIKGLISDEDYATSMEKIETYYGDAETKTSEAQTRINEILTTASNEKRRLSSDEVKELKANMDTINSYTVDSLTQNKDEQGVLLNEIKAQTEKISVETASSMIKSAKTQKDETIKAAEEEYNGVLEKYKNWKTIPGMTEEVYDAIIKDAENTRTQTVLSATTQYDEIYNALKENNSDVSKYIDKDTGGIKKSWKKHYKDLDDETVKGYDKVKKKSETGMKKVQKTVSDNPIKATMSLDTSAARRSYNRLITDIDNSKVGTDVKLKTPYQISTDGLYAQGGMPSVGEMFIAREAGPELVGRIGNKNAVANNDQIIKGIEQGVYNAVTSAIGSGGLGSVKIDLHTDEGVVVDRINKITRQTGVCPIDI